MHYVDLAYVLIWVNMIGVFVSFFRGEYDMLQIFWVCATVLIGDWTLVYFGDKIFSLAGVMSVAWVAFMAIFFVKKLDYCCDPTCSAEGG